SGLVVCLRRRRHRGSGVAGHGCGSQSPGEAMSAPQHRPLRDILVPISVGELMDKITILEIKSERIKNPVQLKNIVHELEALRAVRLGDIDRTMLDKLSAELKRVMRSSGTLRTQSAIAMRGATLATPSSNSRAPSIGSTTSAHD